MQIGVAMAGFGLWATRSLQMQQDQMHETKKLTKIMHGVSSKIADFEAKFLKMQANKIQDTKILMQILKEIKDEKVLIGGQLPMEISQDFCHTMPAGNAIRSKMKMVETLTYLELRFMNLLLDAHEAGRKMQQEIEVCSTIKEMTSCAKQIAEEFVSARIRFRDQLKIEMCQVRAAWEEIANGAADAVMASADAKIEELKKKDGKASEMESWQKWKDEVAKIKEIKWENEVDRFKMV